MDRDVPGSLMPFYLVDAVPAEGGITADVPVGMSWVGNTDGVHYIVRTVTEADRFKLVETEPADEPDWQAGVQVEVDDRRTYQGVVYRCMQAHTTQVGWEPPGTPALWTVARADGDPWVQPTMAEDSYQTGDIVWHVEALWSSQIDANTTEPGTDERWWVQVASLTVEAAEMVSRGGPFDPSDPIVMWRIGGI